MKADLDDKHRLDKQLVVSKKKQAFPSYTPEN